MLYDLKWRVYQVRRLIWLPFYLLGHRTAFGLGLIGVAVKAWLENFWHPVSLAGGAIVVIVVCGAAMRMEALLYPGRAPQRPEKPATPLPPAIASPAGTTVGSSPDEREILMRLPIGLQRFLAEERAAANPSQRQAAE